MLATKYLKDYIFYIGISRDELPVTQIAQLVEHCTGKASVMGPNPFQTCVFQTVISQLLQLCT